MIGLACIAGTQDQQWIVLACSVGKEDQQLTGGPCSWGESSQQRIGPSGVWRKPSRVLGPRVAHNKEVEQAEEETAGKPTAMNGLPVLLSDTAGGRAMTGESKLQRIAPDELPDLLKQLDHAQTTEFALVGRHFAWSSRSEGWPKELQGHAVYQLTGDLIELPHELFRLDRLQLLVLRSLGLQTEAAAAIAEHLGQLTSLDLSNNEVGEAGAQAIAEHLGQLTSLALSATKVGEAGARAIAEHLGQLTSLALDATKVGEAGARAIAEHLGQLTSLSLSGSEVGDAGAGAIAEHLSQLTLLWLGTNTVSDAGVRAIAEHLSQLTSLNLYSNEVSDVGVQTIAEHLGDLTWLRLSRNRVGEAGARAIAEHLGQLTSLDLQFNQVGDVGALAIAEHLAQLTWLDLSANDVGDEGVAAIGKHLSRLGTLNLRSNLRITTIGPPVHLALSTLNIEKTGVADLSPLKSLVLAGLPVRWSGSVPEHGPGIYVEGCPLTHPPEAVAQQGPEAVLNFFREIEAQGVDRLFEAKLLIVGEGGAGKTSLLRRMFLPEMDLPSEDETTRGIDIHRHEFPISDGRSFRLNTWDFGGQQIYHATHQFFLTKRSLYVLVDDTRSDHRSIHDEGFKFWLEVIETLSEGSPLLIFQNEKGGRSKQIDEVGIKTRFANVQEIHRGNLEHMDAAESLSQAVEYFAQRLPHIGEDVPAKWVAIRKDLEALAQSQPYIPLDEYFSVYGRHLELGRDKALHLSHYLHDLGVFLHFQQPRELRRTVFLQDEYNQAIRKCDVFVSLFETKTGKYTEEEFDVARQTYQETGKPLIYTYFRKATVSTSASNRDDLMSLWDFQKKLGELGHFYTEYESVAGLKQHFRDQLDELRAEGLL
ncbi:MAG: hypothetical protein GY719_27930 [bacterium]|nr:hypothetical protein [bacterium]